MINIEIINNIINMLNKDYLKKNYLPLILKLEKDILLYLKEINYQPENIKEIPLKITTENNKYLQEKLDKIKENPEKGLFEGVGFYENIIRDFLEVYHFGFLRNFYLDKNGTFHCEISGMITSSSCTATNNQISNKINFENQIEKLKNLGIELSLKNKTYWLIQSDKNISIIETLLSKIGANHISIKARKEKDNYILNNISFYCKPEKLLLFNEKIDLFKFDISNELNQDELNGVYKNLKEMMSVSYNSDLLSLKDTCGKLVLSYFYNVCVLLNIQTETSKQYEQEFAEERKKNIKMWELRNLIGSNIKPDTFSITMEKLYNNILLFSHSQLNFECEEIKVTPYNIHINFCAITGYSFEDNLIDEETLKNKFECFNGTRDNYDLAILNTNNNIEKLKEEINKKIVNVTYESFEIGAKKIDYTPDYFNYIKSFKISFDNYYNLIAPL